MPNINSLFNCIFGYSLIPHCKFEPKNQALDLCYGNERKLRNQFVCIKYLSTFNEIPLNSHKPLQNSLDRHSY